MRSSARGALADTLVVFISDNGLAYGENRVDRGQAAPLRADRAGAAGDRASGRASASPTPPASSSGTIDLAPTLLDYAAAEPCAAPDECRTPDGRSLRPLVEGRGSWPRDRGLLLELTDTFGYEAIRTPRYLYSELTKAETRPLDEAEIEVYDLERDPGELENLWSADPGRARRLAEELAPRLEDLVRCAGPSTVKGTNETPCE